MATKYTLYCGIYTHILTLYSSPSKYPKNCSKYEMALKYAKWRIYGSILCLRNIALCQNKQN